MSSINRSLQDGATASYTNENLNQVNPQEAEVHSEEPMVARNTRSGRNATRGGRSRGRAGGRVGRSRNPTLTNAPNDNLSEQISRVLMNTLPSILRQVADERREEDQERAAKEADDLRSKLDEANQKHEANLHEVREEMECLKSQNNRVPVERARVCSYKEFMGSKPP